jgi:acyl-CoA thioester hydrolase
MKQFERTIESKTKIRFPDCDPYNHLNNSKYIDYFINAREDQLLDYYNFDLHKMARELGVSWVVVQNNIVYLQPATLMETVLIETRLLSADDKSLLVEALMWDENKTQLKSVFWCKFVHFNLRTKKTETHATNLSDFFNQIVNPIDISMNFEERVKTLRPAKLI